MSEPTYEQYEELEGKPIKPLCELKGFESLKTVGKPEPSPYNAINKPEQPERRKGHNKLVYDKESRTILTVDPHPEQPRCETCKDTGRRAKKVNNKISFDNCPDCPEQPNTELLIVKTIQGLISAANRELGELDNETKMLSCHRNSLVLKALEEIDLFEKTTLFELQKAFE